MTPLATALAPLPAVPPADPLPGRDTSPVAVIDIGSNSVRLVEVALESGARSAYRVDSADELDEAWFEGCDTVGVTSGASVPEILVDDVLAWLADRGCGTVEEVHTAEETLIFSLPPELRRDLKAAQSKAE